MERLIKNSRKMVFGSLPDVSLLEVKQHALIKKQVLSKKIGKVITD